MSEPNQEQTLFRGTSSPIINLGTFLFGGLIVAGALAGAFVVAQPYSFVLFGVAGLAFLYMALRYLLIKIRVYEVTTERIRITTGLFTRRTDELELYRVQDSSLVQPLFLRVFGLGDIEITTHDVSTPTVRLQAIRDARALREELRKSIELCRDKKRVRVAEFE